MSQDSVSCMEVFQADRAVWCVYLLSERYPVVVLRCDMRPECACVVSLVGAVGAWVCLCVSMWGDGRLLGGGEDFVYLYGCVDVYHSEVSRPCVSLCGLFDVKFPCIGVA